MASQTRQAREADRKLSVQTLAIASISSALAAVIVSQFWKSGTAPAAAITPVVITVLSEMLHKPTQAIKTKVTGERTALLPEGAGAGAPPQKTEVAVGAPAADHEAPKPASEERPPPLRDEEGDSVPSDERESREAPISYHKAGSTNGGPPSTTFASLRKRVSLKIVAATAALAFLIGAAILTVPELITGGSVGKTSGGTTLFGGDRSSNTTDEGTDTDQQSEDQDSQQNQQDQTEQQQQDQNSGDPESRSKKGSTTSEQTTPKTQTQQQPQAPSTKQAPAQP